MIGRFLELFTPRDTVSEELSHSRVQVATCVLLLEIAYADKDFSSEESAHILQTLGNRFALSHEEAEELVEVAEEARRDSHDLWRFTNRVNQTCTPEEKREIIREIWRVVYLDGHLESHEDHLIHRMATLLNLNHPQLIEQKMIVLKELRGES